MSPQNPALALQNFKQTLCDNASLTDRVEAIRQLLSIYPDVVGIRYLIWQDSTETYVTCGNFAPLQPAQADPLLTDDSGLRAKLATGESMTFAELKTCSSWLGGCLQRSGIENGRVYRLSLCPDIDGLLLIESEARWLDWIGPWLQCLMELSVGTAHGLSILNADPQPTLVFDARVRPMQYNHALLDIFEGRPLSELEALLPVNYRQLVKASLNQSRAIDQVVSEWDERIFVWTFIPDSHTQQVLVRGQDASNRILAERKAAKASRLYRSITENTTDLISRHTLDGIFLDASPVSWTLLGYWPEQLKGKSARHFFHVNDRGRLAAQAREALEKDGLLTLTYRIRHRDGHFLWFETACRAIFDTYSGGVVEVICISRDITARLKEEETRRRLAEVVEANTDLVLFVDPEGKITYLNPSARQALGITGEPAPPLPTLLDPITMKRLAESGWHAAEQLGVWTIEGHMKPCHESSEIPVSLVLLFHRGADDGRYFSIVARDMTERELREAEQHRHQDEMAHSARLVTLGELASGIAHEINQPLAAVMNYTHASQRYLDSIDDNPGAIERVGQGLQRIAEQAQHAAEVIKRLRRFLRKGQRRLQWLAVNDVIQEALRLCHWEAQQARVEIRQTLAADLPLVFADRVLLEQVLLNLLRNAIDAHREHYRQNPSWLTVGTHETDAKVCIWVRDQGAGVTHDQLERLFTPFFTHKPEGLGLGLSMSRSIIEGFEGTLEAIPEENGLLMMCCLPRQDSSNKDNNR